MSQDLLERPASAASEHQDAACLELYSKRNLTILDHSAELKVFDEQFPLPTADQYLHDYEYPISSWPLIISRKKVAQITGALKPLKRLLVKAVRQYFKGDGQRFSEYFQESEMLYKAILDNEIDCKDFIIRHDVLFSDDTPKFLELNVGTSLGGWQHDWVSHRYLQKMRDCEITKDWDLEYREIMTRVFAAIYESACRLTKRQSINLVMHIPEVAHNQDEMLNEFLKLPSVKDNLRLHLYFFRSANELQIDNDGSVFFQGKRVDSVILGLDGVIAEDASLYLKLTASAVANKIYFPDSPVYGLFGNKQIFSLMHEQDLWGILSEEEKLFIKKHLPWSSSIQESQIFKHGKQHATEEFLLANREQLVLKKGRSMAGKDVVVGKFCDEQTWLETMQSAIESGGWLAQDLVEADKIRAIGMSGEPDSFTTIWGIFDFNNEYSGTFIRADPIGVGNGVVNSSNGAMEFMVIEESKKKIIL